MQDLLARSGNARLSRYVTSTDIGNDCSRILPLLCELCIHVLMYVLQGNQGKLPLLTGRGKPFLPLVLGWQL